MKHADRCRRVAIVTLLAGAWAVGLTAQAPEGPVVMRSENLITWWVVDPTSGVAAFYGGDIIAICQEDPEGYDLLDFQNVSQPNEVARNLVAKGDDVGMSLWDHAPPFVGARLCADILARGTPMATGTADITITGRFPTTWADPDVTAPFGLAARGTLTTPEGETLNVTSHYRCVARGGEQRCTQGVVVS